MKINESFVSKIHVKYNCTYDKQNQYSFWKLAHFMKFLQVCRSPKKKLMGHSCFLQISTIIIFTENQDYDTEFLSKNLFNCRLQLIQSKWRMFSGRFRMRNILSNDFLGIQRCCISIPSKLDVQSTSQPFPGIILSCNSPTE